MKGYCFKGILTNTGWMSPAYIDTDDLGIITYIANEPWSETSYETIEGYAIPGITNAHSHAFQYAMAGLAENLNSSSNVGNFWNWRDKMYRLALTIGPEELENVATFLYTEMIRHGYSQVCEFHYLHHDKNGSPYNNRSELGERLIRAAGQAGIKITLIPILYQQGGFGEQPFPEQRRFISHDIEEYNELWAASNKSCKLYSKAKIAHGIHSIRAASSPTITSYLSSIKDDLPIHMHIAEQLKEIEGAIDYLGCRPVEWMLNNSEINQNYHFVHATHMTQKETKALAASGASVVLCPSTEGNLGDGLFNLQIFKNNGGSWSIGTDSHIGLNPMEELRMLDYGQRIHSHNRTTFQNQSEEDCGLYALNQIISSGRKAAGTKDSRFFDVGIHLDALIFNAHHPLIASTSLDFLSSTIVYASDPSMCLGTMIDGQWMVKNGRHINAELINSRFIESMNFLKYR